MKVTVILGMCLLGSMLLSTQAETTHIHDIFYDDLDFPNFFYDPVAVWREERVSKEDQLIQSLSSLKGTMNSLADTKEKVRRQAEALEKRIEQLHDRITTETQELNQLRKKRQEKITRKREKQHQKLVKCDKKNKQGSPKKQLQEVKLQEISIVGFKPKDLTIYRSDNVLRFDGKTEHVDDGIRTKQEFTKVITLPKSVDPRTLRIEMQDDNTLVLWGKESGRPPLSRETNVRQEDSTEDSLRFKPQDRRRDTPDTNSKDENKAHELSDDEWATVETVQE